MANPYASSFNRFGNAFGVSPHLLQDIGRRESGFDAGAVNDWDINARNGVPSKGLMQFIEPTFNSFYDQARSARPELIGTLGSKNWNDPNQQIAVAAWAIANGKGSHWATYNDAMASTQGKTGNLAGGGGATPSMGGSPSFGSAPQAVKNRLLKGGNFGRLSGVLSQQASGTAANSTAMDSSPVASGGGDVPARKPGEPAWQWLQRIGRQKFGLVNDPGNNQTTGGRHTEGSLHYDERAIDFGDARNSWEKLNAWYSWVDRNRQALGVQELLNEGDHIHVGVRG